MTICYLNKAEKEHWLPRLFALYYENMSRIAPGDMAFEAEREEWMRNVSPALDKAPRQVLLALDGDKLAGYVQFYTRAHLLMVEEVQLRREYQGSLLFLRLCRRLMVDLPRDICLVEAYADRRNSRSLALMRRLGMTEVPESSQFLHLRGDARAIAAYFRPKGTS